MSESRNHPDIGVPNCPEHNDEMEWDAENERFLCTHPCGWQFHI